MAKRRGTGEGSIFRRKDGRWVAVLYIDGDKVSRYARTQAKAIEKLHELLSLKRQGLRPTTVKTKHHPLVGRCPDC
jgi:hypothetical protein